MKKYLILLAGVILVAMSGYFGWKLNQSRSVLVEPPVSEPDGVNKNFQSSGVLTRNNPGQKAGVWYLTNDLPGKPANLTELAFTSESECYLGNQKIICSELSLPNGSRVRVNGTNMENYVEVVDLSAEGAADLISVDNIVAGDSFESPINITGRARGSWYFEATFPVRLAGLSGRIITSTYAEAKEDWMTTEFVPFKATVSFDVTTTTEADLILAADNPSGLPQYDRDIRIRVRLLPPKNTRAIDLYFYDSGADRDASGNVLCSRQGLAPVKRNITDSGRIISDAVDLLLQGGLSDAERASGISTEFPLDGLKFTGSSVNNGVATLNFSDPLNKTSGGSCRAGILWMQIEATVKQFPGIKEVKFRPETLFQP